MWIVIDGILEKDNKAIFSSFGNALNLFYQFLTFAGYTIVTDSIILIKEKEFDQIQLFSHLETQDQDDPS